MPARVGRERERDQHPVRFAQIGKAVENRLRSVGTHGPAARWAIRNGKSSEKELQVVIYLGNRSDRGTRTPDGGTGFDRDTGRYAVDEVGIGRVHPFEELPRVGREGLYIAPLPLGIEGMQRETGFSGTAHPRQGNKTVQRNVYVDVFEIVLANASQAYKIVKRQSGIPPKTKNRRTDGIVSHSCGLGILLRQPSRIETKC